MVAIILCIIITALTAFFVITLGKASGVEMTQAAVSTSWSNEFARLNLEDKKRAFRRQAKKTGVMPKNAIKKEKSWDKQIEKYHQLEEKYYEAQRFSFEEVLPLFGYQIIEMFNISVTKLMHDLIRTCEYSGFEKLERGKETYGKRNSNIYAGFIMAKCIGFAYVGVIMALFVALLFILMGREITNALMFASAAFVLVFIIGYIPLDEINTRKNKRQEELDRELPNAISKLTLLTTAGMNVMNAMEETAKSGDSVIYRELARVVKEVKQSYSLSQALSAMQTRCKNSYLDKMVSILSKSYTIGNTSLSDSLMEINQECWFDKRQQTKRISAAVGAKLMVPSLLMFIGILVVILIPAMAGMGM